MLHTGTFMNVSATHPDRFSPALTRMRLRRTARRSKRYRADLFALYYLADPKLQELGILDNPEAYKAEYYKYMLNGLMTQLNRIEPGKDVEERPYAQPSANRRLDPRQGQERQSG